MNTKDIEMYELYSNPETREDGIMRAFELTENQIRTVFLAYYPGLKERGIYEDVLQECRLEILRILPRYDLSRNIRFTTFCDLYIKNRMMEYINKSVNGVSYYKSRTYGHPTFSNFEENYMEKSAESPESIIEDIYNKEIVEQFLSCLNPKHQYLIRSYYGIGCDFKTVKELARELEMTTTQVNRMKQDCLNKIRRKNIFY